MPNEETTNQRTVLAELTDVAALGGLVFAIGAAAYLLIHWHFTEGTTGATASRT